VLTWLRFVDTVAATDFQGPHYAPDTLTHTHLGMGRVARQGFARGLWALWSSYSGGRRSVTLDDYRCMKTLRRTASLQTVTLSRDVRMHSRAGSLGLLAGRPGARASRQVVKGYRPSLVPFSPGEFDFNAARSDPRHGGAGAPCSELARLSSAVGLVEI